MKNVYFFILLALTCQNVFGQGANGVYRFKNGSDISKMMSYRERFQFEKFLDGVVMFRGGRITKAKLNYSVVHGEVMFVNMNNDTMLLTDNDYVKSIMVGESPFMYSKGHGHIELAGQYGEVRLARKLFLARLGTERNAAYSQYSSTSAIASYSSYMNGDGRIQFLEGSDKVILRKRVAYFLVDQNDRVYNVTKGNLLKVYSSHKRKVSEFMKSNDTNLEKESDLMNIMAYCGSL